MDVFALTMRLKEEGAATVEAAMDKMRRSMNSAKKEANGLDGAFGSLKNAMQGLVAGLSVGLVLQKIVDETSAAQFATAQLNAALKSTNGIAGQSADALTEHASALQKVTVFGDDAIISAQSLLLTFTKIQGDVFPRATEAVLDVAQAMGTDLKSAAIQVGKALNDPILGVTALARSGIQFTDAQKAMIAQLVETNRLTEAQSIILQELQTQFGGSARAARDTLGGALKALGNNFGDLFEISDESSRGIVNSVNAITDSLFVMKDMLNDVVQFFSVAFVGMVKAVNNIFIILQQMIVSAVDDFVALFEILRYIPGVGTLAGKGLDKVRGSLQGIMANLKAEQQSWVDWEQRQYQNIFVGQKVEQQMRRTASATSEAAAAAAGKGKGGEAKIPEIKPGALIFGAGAFGQLRQVPIEVELIAKPKFDPEQLSNEVVQMGMQFGAMLRDALANSVASAFETLVTRGATIGDAFGALTSTLLQGVGNMLIQFGTAMLPISALFAKLVMSFRSMNPVAMTAAALGMIAVGGMMRGAASRAFGGVSAGGGGGGAVSAMTSAMTGGSLGMPNLFYGPTAAGSASTIAQIPAMNVTIIGPNDPSAQRQMQDLMRNAMRRGDV